jgi:hypothetical protein
MRDAAPWAYKTDITAFFDQIARPDLHASIRRHVSEESLHDLLIAASECEVDETKPSVRRALRDSKIRVGAGVRQGMPLSPFFANILMVQFDHSLMRRGISALRYADDLIFFGATEQECVRHHEYCKEKLAELGLAVPDIGPLSKSRIFAPDETADFLGLGIALRDGRYRAVVTSNQFRKMREKFLTLGDVDSLNSRQISFAMYGNLLEATAEGYLTCYEFADNHVEVENQIDDFKKMALANLFKSTLQIDPRTLQPAARAFFGLGKL